MDYYGLLFLYYLKGLSGKSVLRLFFNIEAGGTEQLLPENTSTPTTTPILADIQYPDGLRTDQYFTYRETPTTVSNKARIKTIKGNTLVWNQLAEVALPSTSSSGITMTNNNDGSFTLNGTATTQADFRISTTNGTDNLHNYTSGKYLLICEGLSSSIQLIIMSYPDYVRMATFTASPTLTLNPITGKDNCFIMIRIANGTTLNNVKLRPQLFNLTQMFGDGNEPITVEEFTSLFPLSYYSYNQGSLLSFNGRGLKTTGKNLLEIKNNNRTAYGISYTVNDDKSITALGTATATSYFIFTNSDNSLSEQNETPFKKGMSLIFSTNTSKRLTYRDRTGTYGYFNLEEVITLSQDIACIYFEFARGENIDMTIYPMVRLSTVNDSTYEPYTSSTLSLPVSTYFPTGMKSAVDVYDELTDSKAITRIGAVDLGTLSWTWQPTWQAWYTYQMSESLKGASNNDTKPNIVSANYPTLVLNNILGTSTFGISTSNVSTSNKLIAVENGSDTVTPTGYLYYELATPTETPITTEDANEALSLLMGKSVSSSNANQMINIITKGE